MEQNEYRNNPNIAQIEQLLIQISLDSQRDWVCGVPGESQRAELHTARGQLSHGISLLMNCVTIL